jgi:hypothetical protein
MIHAMQSHLWHLREQWKKCCNKLSAVVLFHITWLCVVYTNCRSKVKKNLELLMALSESEKAFFWKCIPDVGEYIPWKDLEKILSFKSKFMSYCVALRWKIHEKLYMNIVKRKNIYTLGDGDECVSCWFLFFKFELLCTLWLVIELRWWKIRKERDLRFFCTIWCKFLKGEEP